MKCGSKVWQGSMAHHFDGLCAVVYFVSFLHHVNLLFKKISHQNRSCLIVLLIGYCLCNFPLTYSSCCRYVRDEFLFF